MGKVLSLSTLIIAFLVSLASGYLEAINKIKFETLLWIVIGALTILIIIAYQEIYQKLDSLEWEQKRIDEKLKIYQRLNKIEERLKT